MRVQDGLMTIGHAKRSPPNLQVKHVLVFIQFKRPQEGWKADEGNGFHTTTKNRNCRVIRKTGKNYKALERVKRITKGIRLGIPKRSTKIMRD